MIAGFGITLDADTRYPQRVIIFCLECKYEGRDWILPDDCPHEWQTGAEYVEGFLVRWKERVKQWMETVSERLRNRRRHEG